MKTVLVALAHPDDEIGCAGTIATHTDRGDRVVLLWLTRGTMTQVLAAHEPEDVARIRTEHGRESARILGAEPRFLDFPDTAVTATPEAAADVARVVADVKPDTVLTWGDAWGRGMRHPDHQATGKIVRDAVTLARIGRVVAPLEPHRADSPIYTLRDGLSTMPVAAIDVTGALDRIRAVATFYRERIGWPEDEWLEERLKKAGTQWGVEAAELFDAWETTPGLSAYLI